MSKFIKKAIYNPIVNFILRNLLKPVVKTLNKKMPISISGILFLKYKSYAFKLKTNPTSFVTQTLFLNGCKEYEFTSIFENLIKDSEVFFDVGANIGYFSILGSKINNSCKIFAFEPSIGPKFYLKENIRINQTKNVFPIEYAIADIKGKLIFHDVYNKSFDWLEYNLNGSHSLQNNFGTNREKSYEVEVITLKKFKEEKKLERVDLIKLDTEYTEHIIMRSSIDFLNEDKPIILCEVYEEISNEMQDVINMLPNYKIYQIIKDKIHPIKSFKELVDTNENNFIFCHDEYFSLIHKFI